MIDLLCQPEHAGKRVLVCSRHPDLRRKELSRATEKPRGRLPNGAEVLVVSDIAPLTRVSGLSVDLVVLDGNPNPGLLSELHRRVLQRGGAVVRIQRELVPVSL